jgi:hypothetical protein
VEKPVALRATATRLAASASGRDIRVPAMCMRFWPAVAEARVDERSFDAEAVFRRLDRRPPGQRFYGTGRGAAARSSTCTCTTPTSCATASVRPRRS